MRFRSVFSSVVAAVLLATSAAGAQVPAGPTTAADRDKLDALPSDDPGFRSPGYPKYYPGMAMIRRGEMTVRMHGRIETRIGVLPMPPKDGDEAPDNLFTNGDRVERTGFSVPRARFGLNGQVANHIPFLITADLARPDDTGAGEYLMDAWVGYDRFRFFKLWLGARTVPFSRSAILSSADAGLSERARSADAMAPFRQVGLTIGGDYDLLGLSWRLGVYNAFDRYGEFYRGVINSVGLRGNRFNGLSEVFRLSLEPMGPVGENVADLEGGKLRLHVGGGMYMNDSGSTQTQGTSADLHIKVAGLHALFEWIADSADPSETPTTPATIPAGKKRQAISAELGYTLGKNGVAVRTELIDQDTAIEDNRDEMWLSVALNHHFLGNMARFSLQFDHRQELNGEPRDNDSLYGKLALRF